MNFVNNISPHKNPTKQDASRRYRSIEALKLLIKDEPLPPKYLQVKPQRNSPNNKSCDNSRAPSLLLPTQNALKGLNQSSVNHHFVPKNRLQNQESLMIPHRSPQFSKSNVSKSPFNEKRLKTDQLQPLGFQNNRITIKQKSAEKNHLDVLKLYSPPKMNLSSRSYGKSESNNGSLLSEDEKNFLQDTFGGVKIQIKTVQRNNLLVSGQRERVKVRSLRRPAKEQKKVKIPSFIKEKQNAKSRKSSAQLDGTSQVQKIVTSAQISKFFNKEMDTGFQIQINIKPALKKRTVADFQLLKKLGEGGIARAYLALQKNINFLCVLKVINKKKLNQYQAHNLIREMKIQSFMNHPHLAGLYGYFDDQSYIYLIVELLPSGDLKKKVRNRCYPQDKTAYIVHQVCKGISYMHQYSIIHRDIKPQNIFMFKNYAKLGDFGCSVICDEKRISFVGSPYYLSPEQLQNQAYDHKVDVWQIGTLTFELLYKNYPFEKDINKIVRGMNEKKQLSELVFPQKNNVSDQAKDFMQKCLEKNHNTRITLSQVLSHNFLKKIQDASVVKLC